MYVQGPNMDQTSHIDSALLDSMNVQSHLQAEKQYPPMPGRQQPALWGMQGVYMGPMGDSHMGR